MFKFTLPKVINAPAVINGRRFDENGELIIQSEVEADLLARVFVNYYGCTVEKLEQPATQESAPNSLSVTVTKPD